MPRYKLTIEYDGRAFCGWQRQEAGIPTVQQTLEDAIHDFCGEEVTLHCSGRTDAGVHARAQVAHLDLAKPREPFRIMQAVNAHLIPHLVSVIGVEAVTEDFHARYSATGRRYLYRIVNRRARLALEEGRAWHVPVPLDISAMREAAALLLGKHDFSTFRDSMCQAASPIKTLDRLDIEQQGEEIHIHAAARSFLHHQVRNMTGSLALVGKGKWSVADFRAAFEAKDRTAGGPTAPPDGLYFMEVRFD